ncbi:hypothetical protein E5676_scaffold1503G00020 [Cucumis melo var. makuwa]|uniref:Uncharacterized protein n=1 Tax=Cucumis melo var. makuwa TaxID=1194695 RepID=A0A5D3CAI1_CUCMM|nr:hypothetical protein E6C27_scaffold280G003930 [Cucumis melo var. makuwa]TYK08188.1 hypothetical protein E5676_scaffold1503G00020 [Cucumis melo var. makuwa]
MLAFSLQGIGHGIVDAIVRRQKSFNIGSPNVENFTRKNVESATSGKLSRCAKVTTSESTYPQHSPCRQVADIDNALSSMSPLCVEDKATRYNVGKCFDVEESPYPNEEEESEAVLFRDLRLRPRPRPLE